MKSRWTLLLFAVNLLAHPVRADLKTEQVSTNGINTSRNGQLVLVRGQTGTNSWSEYIYFKGNAVLLRILEPKLTAQIFFENSPIKLAEYDSGKDGRFDVIELYEMLDNRKIIHDSFHIANDDRLTPFSDEELMAVQQMNDGAFEPKSPTQKR